MMKDEDLFEGIQLSYELNKINETLEDPEVTRALMLLARLMVKPNVSVGAAIPLIVQLQVYSSEFHLRFKYYMSKGKGEEDAVVKKNYYASLSEAIEKVVSALKYIPKG